MNNSLFFDIKCVRCGGVEFDCPEQAASSDIVVCETCEMQYQYRTLLTIAKSQALQMAKVFVEAELLKMSH